MFGYYHSSTQLYSRFGVRYLGYGNYYTTGNINTLTGQTGSLLEGYNYNYLYKNYPDNYNDKLTANGGTIFFKSQDNIGRAVNYGGAANSYRAIHASFIFGAVRGGATAKNELMNIYMNYLTKAPGFEDLIVRNIRDLSVSPNPFNSTSNIRFSLVNSDRVSIKVYNVTGQLVRNLVDTQLPKGNHHYAWKGISDDGKKLASGTYLLRIDTAGEIESRVVVYVD